MPAIGIGISPVFVRNVESPITPIPPPPYALFTLNNITGLNYTVGSGPSTASSAFALLGLGLVPAADNITVTPPSNFEVFDGTVWRSAAFNVAYAGGAITTGNIYRVRLKAGLVAGGYSQNVVVTAPNTTPFNLAVSGSVLPGNEFVFTVKTNNAGTSGATQFTLPLRGGSIYNCLIEWGDGTSTTQTTDVSPTHTYGAAGNYQIKISGTFPAIFFSNTGDKLKLISIDNWGTIGWKTFESAFYGCTNMTGTFIDAPVLTNVTNATAMFADCAAFNSDLSSWVTSTFTATGMMFQNCTLFNGNVSTWDMSSVTNANMMFLSCPAFNRNLNSWNVSNVQNFQSFFNGCVIYNQPLNNWDTGSATNMLSMFQGCTVFNQAIGTWDVSSVTTMSQMFLNCIAFNQSLNAWTPTSLLNMSGIFSGCAAFNQPLNSWSTGTVTNMSAAFNGCTVFNQALSSWNTSSVTNMSQMFFSATAFNQSINAWNVSNVTTMLQMFVLATSFNQPLNLWTTTNCTTMQAMFNGASAFNQSISSWNVTNVTSMSFMFQNATAFNQDISAWNVIGVVNFGSFMNGKTAANYSAANLDAIYNTWSLLAVQPNLSISFGSIKYTAAGSAGKAVLAGAPNNWTIVDGGI